MNLTNLSEGSLSLLRAMGKGEIFTWDREVSVYIYLGQFLDFEVARELIFFDLAETTEKIEDNVITYTISEKGRDLL